MRRKGIQLKYTEIHKYLGVNLDMSLKTTVRTLESESSTETTHLENS